MASAIRPWSLRAMVAVAVLACGGGGDGGGGITNPDPDPTPNPPSATASVTLGAASFSPTSVTLSRNGTVTWNNTSGITHNVTFTTTGSPSNIGDHSSGSNQRTFPTAGTFNFYCTFHGTPSTGMTGSVTVQ